MQLPLTPAESVRKLNEWETSELKKQKNSLLREILGMCSYGRIFL